MINRLRAESEKARTRRLTTRSAHCSCRPPGSYLLQLDISKFFYSIDRGILISQLERKIKDKRLAAVMAMFLDHGEPVGIPIGNLLSQLYALIYLNDLDHFIKREMKARLYCRYVDDFILFGLTRSECEKALARITQFLRDKLRLGLSRATIAPVTRGVNFVGYRTWASKRFIRKRSMYNFRRAVKRQRLESIVSILGHARHTHSQGALIRSLENHRGIRRELPKVYKRAAHCRAAGAAAGG